MAVERYNCICLVVIKHIKHNRSICCCEFNGYIGIFIVKINVVRVYHILANRVGRDDVNMSLALILFCKAVLEIIGKRTNLVSIRNKLASSFGERDRMIDTLEQKAVNDLLSNQAA